MKFTTIIRFIIPAIIYVGCSQASDQDLIQFFHKHSNSFEILRELIERKYILDPNYRDRNQVVLLDCTNYRKRTGKEICDDDLEKLFHELKISEAQVSKSLCSSTMNSHEIRFIVESSPLNAEVISFVFDECTDVHMRVDRDTFREIRLGANWSIQIENSFP